MPALTGQTNRPEFDGMSSPLIIPDRCEALARHALGAFFEPISGLSRDDCARDFLNASRALIRAKVVERYVALDGAKVLEIGSGFGTNIAVWQRYLNVDAYGVEPEGEGFDGGYEASQLLLAANGIEATRVIRACGERLPFPDESFDVVYSANVLEHTSDPATVLAEAVRVLRPGGTLHFEIPNHLSYFEGHYMVLSPPLVHRAVLPWWVRLLGRDPAFSRTLRTEINPIWCRRAVRTLAKQYDLELVSLGEELFLERLSKRYVFEAKEVAKRLDFAVRLLQRMNVGNWIGKTIVALQAHYPLYLTVRKGPSRRSD